MDTPNLSLSNEANSLFITNKKPTLFNDSRVLKETQKLIQVEDQINSIDNEIIDILDKSFKMQSSKVKKLKEIKRNLVSKLQNIKKEVSPILGNNIESRQEQFNERKAIQSVSRDVPLKAHERIISSRREYSTNGRPSWSRKLKKTGTRLFVRMADSFQRQVESTERLKQIEYAEKLEIRKNRMKHLTAEEIKAFNIERLNKLKELQLKKEVTRLNKKADYMKPIIPKSKQRLNALESYKTNVEKRNLHAKKLKEMRMKKTCFSQVVNMIMKPKVDRFLKEEREERIESFKVRRVRRGTFNKSVDLNIPTNFKKIDPPTEKKKTERKQPLEVLPDYLGEARRNKDESLSVKVSRNDNLKEIKSMIDRHTLKRMSKQKFGDKYGLNWSMSIDLSKLVLEEVQSKLTLLDKLINKEEDFLDFDDF